MRDVIFILGCLFLSVHFVSILFLERLEKMFLFGGKKSTVSTDKKKNSDMPSSLQTVMMSGKLCHMFNLWRRRQPIYLYR